MEQDLIRLQDHVAVLRRRWRLVALCLLLAIGAGLAVSYTQTPMYRGTTSLLLQPEQSADDTSSEMQPEEVATQADVIASVGVAERVVDELALAIEPQELLEHISVEVVEDKRVVDVAALERTAQRAADVANAFAEQYIEYRETQAAEAASARRQEYTDQISELDQQIQDVRRDLNDASGRRERRELRDQHAAYLAQRTNLQSQLAVIEANQAGPLPGGEVLLRAEPPSQPAEPRPLRSGALGGVVGLLLGVGLAYVRDRLDDAIRDEQRLRSAVSGRPILGSIPSSPEEAKGRVSTLLAPQSPLSEAFRTLNTNVRFLLAAERSNDPGRGDVVLVTSAGPGEGKTSVATNLAVAAARVGKRVIVVDADLRRPTVASRFGLDIPIGLSDLLAAGGPAHPQVQEVGVDGLTILASGSTPPNPAELLASPVINGIFDELAEHADLVIVDSAPVLRVADSLELVSQADLLLLVARRKVSRLRNVQAAAERIRQVGGTLSGSVLNDVDSRDSSYGYGYPARPEPNGWSLRRRTSGAQLDGTYSG